MRNAILWRWLAGVGRNVFPAVAFLLLLAAETFPQSAAPAGNPPVIQSLTEGENHITLSPADRRVVRLPAQPGTGFMWFATTPENGAVKVISTGFASDRPASSTTGATVGAVQDQYFAVTAIEPGTSDVVFEYRRPHSPKPAKTISVKIVVQN